MSRQSRDEVTFTLFKGPNRAIRALLNTPGIGLGDVVPPLIRRVGEVLNMDNGQGTVRTDPVVLDLKTRNEIKSLESAISKVFKEYTWNRPINMGAMMLWDRMDMKMDPGAVKKAFEFLGIER